MTTNSLHKAAADRFVCTDVRLVTRILERFVRQRLQALARNFVVSQPPLDAEPADEGLDFEDGAFSGFRLGNGLNRSPEHPCYPSVVGRRDLLVEPHDGWKTQSIREPVIQAELGGQRVCKRVRCPEILLERNGAHSGRHLHVSSCLDVLSVTYRTFQVLND